LDLPGRAVVTPATGQSFSHLPSWQQLDYRKVHEAPTDSGGGSLALLHAKGSN
jgi:hypothetical protein